jgi:hypothetical protein
LPVQVIELNHLPRYAVGISGLPDRSVGRLWRTCRRRGFELTSRPVSFRIHGADPMGLKPNFRPVRLAYQPPANSTFLSEKSATINQPALFSLRTNQHRPSATSQLNRLFICNFQVLCSKQVYLQHSKSVGAIDRSGSIPFLVCLLAPCREVRTRRRDHGDDGACRRRARPNCWKPATHACMGIGLTLSSWRFPVPACSAMIGPAAYGRIRAAAGVMILSATTWTNDTPSSTQAKGVLDTRYQVCYVSFSAWWPYHSQCTGSWAQFHR